jgi:hypothetical protein
MDEADDRANQIDQKKSKKTKTNQKDLSRKSKEVASTITDRRELII